MTNTRQIKTTDDIKKLGTILSVWAHPDDESYLCGGIMAVAVDNGQRIICVTATKGEQGVQNEARWPADRLGDIRAAELEEALKIMGITEHRWLGYGDGCCSDSPSEKAIDTLVDLIETCQVDTILTFGPDGLTGHPDHCSVSAWATQAAHQSKRPTVVYYCAQLRQAYERMQAADERFNIFFNIDAPPLINEPDAAVLLHLPDAYLDKKYQALLAMPSQTEAMFKHFGKDYMRHMIEDEAFVRA